VGSDRGSYFLTRSGKKIHYFDVQEDDLDLEDIIPAIANIPRFNGHVGSYSVAEHSYWVAKLVPDERELRLWGLLHDASEAYLGDIAKPLKDALPELQSVENNILLAIAFKFGLPWPIPEEVIHADKVMLATEVRDLYPKECHEHFVLEVEPTTQFEVHPWKPTFARSMLESCIRYYL